MYIGFAVCFPVALIILIIATIIGGSTVVMSVTGVLSFQDELAEGRSQGFRALCVNELLDD